MKTRLGRCIRAREPLDCSVIAVFLRKNVRNVLFADRTAMDPHLPGRSPVNVRLMGTVTQPFKILQVLGQTPSDSEPRQIAECSRHVKSVTQPNHSITDDHFCAVPELAHLAREVPFGEADDLVSLLADGELFDMMRCFKDALIFPSIQRLELPASPPLDTVIVHGCPPEIGLWSPERNGAPVEVNAGQALIIEFATKVAMGDPRPL